MVCDSSTWAPFVENNQMRALSVWTAERVPRFANVPTLKELGYDVEFSIWVGLFAPKGTPEPVIARLRADTKKAVENEQFKKSIANIGDVVAYLDQPEFKTFWDADAKRVEDAVQTIGKVQG
jgi:tripartite-type tricarboxylate transporter receptor subunit TctC